MLNEYQLLKAKQEDEFEAYKLVCELEDQMLDRALFHRIWRWNMEQNVVQYYLLKCQGNVVGLCSLRIMLPLHHCAKIAELEEFVIKKEYQRQGIGTIMFHNVIKEAQKQGCLQIELSSRNTRMAAHAFYHVQGMKQEHSKFTLKLDEKNLLIV